MSNLFKIVAITGNSDRRTVGKDADEQKTTTKTTNDAYEENGNVLHK